MATLAWFTRPTGGVVHVNPLNVNFVVSADPGPRGEPVARVCFPGGDFVDVAGALERVVAALNASLKL